MNRFLHDNFPLIVVLALVSHICSTGVMAAPLSGGVQHAEQLSEMDGTLIPGKGFDSRNVRVNDSGDWFAIPIWLTGTWHTVQLTRIKKVDERTGSSSDAPKIIKLRERETFGFQRDRLRNVWTLRRAPVPIISVGEVSSDDDTTSLPATTPLAVEPAATLQPNLNVQPVVMQQPSTPDTKKPDPQKKKSKREKKTKKEKAAVPATTSLSPDQVSKESASGGTLPVAPPEQKPPSPSTSDAKPGLAVSLFVIRENQLISIQDSRVILRTVDSVVTVREDNNAIESVVQRELIRTIVPVSEGVISISSDVRVFDRHGFPKYDETLLEMRTREREFEVVDELKGVSLYASFTKFLQKIGKLSLSPERGD